MAWAVFQSVLGPKLRPLLKVLIPDKNWQFNTFTQLIDCKYIIFKSATDQIDHFDYN